MYVRDAVFKGRKGELPICHAKPHRVIHLLIFRHQIVEVGLGCIEFDR